MERLRATLTGVAVTGGLGVSGDSALVGRLNLSFDASGGLLQNHGAVALSLNSHPSAGRYVINCAGLTASAVLLVSLNAQYKDTASIVYTSGTTLTSTTGLRCR